MQFVALIYQGTTPLPNTPEWDALSQDEQRQIYADYAELNETPGLTPGPPLGLPANATTVRVQEGRTVTSEGPYLSNGGTVAGYVVLEADDIDAVVEIVSRIPAARLGGAVEVRPSAKYW